MKTIKKNLDLIVILLFILFCISAIIKADNIDNMNINVLNKPENIEKYNYMDSCYVVYQTIDAAYHIDDGDAIDCEYYDNAINAWEHLDIETFKTNWRELDKDIICFLKYRAFEENEIAAFNLLQKYYPNIIKSFIENESED